MSAQPPQVSLGGAAAPDRAATDAANADADLRAKLAEQIIAAKETPGREFAPRFRATLIEKLKALPVQELQKRLDTRMILTPDALGDSAADLTYTPLSGPCRIIDTRSAGGALTGGAPGPSRSFTVAGSTNLSPQGGSPTGCGVPVGATAVLINFVAVNPQGLGNLRGTAFPNSVPTTGSIVNYQALTPTLNVANGLLFPICNPAVSTCTFDITLLANGAGTDVVADVLGYAAKFPKEQVRSFTTTTQTDLTSTQPPVTTTCTNVASLTVVAPVAGQVHIRANTIMNMQHTAGVGSLPTATVSTTPTSCNGQRSLDFDYAYFASYPTGSANITLRPEAVFPVSAGSTTFYLNTDFLVSSSDTGTVYWVGWISTFEPN